LLSRKISHAENFFYPPLKTFSDRLLAMKDYVKLNFSAISRDLLNDDTAVADRDLLKSAILRQSDRDTIEEKNK